MRENFDTEYIDVATSLNEMESARRKLLSPAKASIGVYGTREDISAEKPQNIYVGFTLAVNKGDFGQLKQLPCEGALVVAYNERKVAAFNHAIQGESRVEKLLGKNYADPGKE